MAATGRDTRQREQVLDSVADRLGPQEQVVAVLPFASTPKRPKGPTGKVREGIYTSYRRYRPLVLTSRRLFVVGAGRTPYPRGVLAEFALPDVRVVGVEPASFGQTQLRLELAGVGTVPFNLGRFDLVDLPELRAALEPQ
jgi:hypothetical protein